MSTTSDLYNLINGLTKSEKRYFKVFAKKHQSAENKDYLTLFNKIGALPEADDNKLKRKLKQYQGILKKLPVLKNYLYQTILESLRNFHKDKSIDLTIYRLLETVHILFDKNHHEQVLKLLTKARALAESYEKHSLLLIISDWEHTVYRKKRDNQALKKFIGDGYPEQQDLMKILENKFNLRKLESEIFALKEDLNYVRNEREARFFDQIIRNPLLKDENQALSFDAKKSYYTTLYIYHRVKGNLVQGYEMGKQIVHLFDQYPKEIETRPQQYLVTIGNLLGIQKELGKYEECVNTLEKFNPIKGKSNLIDKEVFLLEYQVRLIISLDLGHYNEGIRLKEPILEGLKKYEGLIRQDWILDFYFDQALLHLMAGKLDQALDWINTMLNAMPKDQMLQKHTYARLLDLMIRYDMGDNRYLVNAIRSTYRFLSSRERLYDFENLVLKFLKTLPKVKNWREYRRNLLWLQEELQSLAQNPNEKRVMNYLHFPAWLESKINQMPFAKAVQKRASETGYF